jgi:hypothetical protein
MSEDAGIKARAVATAALAVRCSNQAARSHQHTARSHSPTHIDLFYTLPPCLPDAELMCPRPKILECCAPLTKRPLDIVPLTYVSRPWTVSIGRYRGLGRPPAPNGSVGRLAGFAYAADQVHWIGAPQSDARSPTHRTPPLRSDKRATVGSRVSLRSI